MTIIISTPPLKCRNLPFYCSDHFGRGDEMRKTARAALAVLALGAMVGEPVLAAELVSEQQGRVGVFGGVRVNLTLGGRTADGRARAGLALAPTTRGRTASGATRMRIGEGIQFGLAERGRAELTFGGTRVDRLGIAPGRQAPNGPRAGVSTLGWVGIGAGVVLVGIIGYGIWLHEALECDPGDDCS
jgi:hypothetical protein